MARKRKPPELVRTAGAWDPAFWPIFFPAAYIPVLELAGLTRPEDYLLLAVNDLISARTHSESLVTLERWLAKNVHVLLDSGVYWLATEHAKQHEVSMNEALQLAPADIDGFEPLYKTYVAIAQTYGDRLWGYIEIDQGGRENKLRTRAQLEGLGLRPIPVYHPLNDGWDYFDELARQYDRICIGNLVHASPDDRRRVLATIWERRRRYPQLWIHILGISPNDTLLAYPMNSFDSSAWMGGVRWSGGASAATFDPVFRAMVSGFGFTRGDSDGPTGWKQAARFAAYSARFLDRTVRNFRHDLEGELGADSGMFVEE